MNNPSGIIPLHKNVLIKQDRPETQVGALQLAASAVTLKDTGTIVATGPGVTFGFNQTNYVPSVVGKRCKFSGVATTSFKVGDDVFIMVDELDVMCFLEAE